MKSSTLLSEIYIEIIDESRILAEKKDIFIDTIRFFAAHNVILRSNKS